MPGLPQMTPPVAGAWRVVLTVVTGHVLHGSCTERGFAAELSCVR
jgi:hypothetical protein